MVHKCDGCKYKGEYQVMMFRPMGVCNRGSNLVEAVQNYESEKCPYKKTNADRIRAMSDEELAELLNDFRCGSCLRNGNNCFPHGEKTLEWLQKPAKEGDHD